MIEARTNVTWADTQKKMYIRIYSCKWVNPLFAQIYNLFQCKLFFIHTKARDFFVMFCFCLKSIPSWSILRFWCLKMHHTLGQRTFSLTFWCRQSWSGPLAVLPRVRSRQRSSQSSRTPHTASRSSWHCKSSGREHVRRSGQAGRYGDLEDLHLTFRVPGPPSKTTHTAGMVTLLPGGQTSTRSILVARKTRLSGDDICSDSSVTFVSQALPRDEFLEACA